MGDKGRQKTLPWEMWKLRFQVSSCYRHIRVGIRACDSITYVFSRIYDIHLIIGFRSFRLGLFSCISRACGEGFPGEKSIFRVRRYILTVSMSSVTISKRLPFRRATLPQRPQSGHVIPLNRYVSLAVV